MNSIILLRSMKELGKSIFDLAKQVSVLLCCSLLLFEPIWYCHQHKASKSYNRQSFKKHRTEKKTEICMVKWWRPTLLKLQYWKKLPLSIYKIKKYFSGWSGGDPHIKTLDGLTYTFNGIGDYNLLSLKNRSDFIVHCRMSKATVVKNVTTAASKATVFSAFALSAFQGALVEIYLNVSSMYCISDFNLIADSS